MDASQVMAGSLRTDFECITTATHYEITRCTYDETENEVKVTQILSTLQTDINPPIGSAERSAFRVLSTVTVRSRSPKSNQL